MKIILKSPNRILTIIVFSQFCCTSLWFAGNSIINDLISTFNISSQSLGNLTSAVQFGFILGTFLFALLTITDRFSPSRVFFISAILGALMNLCILFYFNSIYSLITFRFLTGFFLAGIYPVGMKIASDYYKKGLGKSLSYLVGALVLGTALPHLLKALDTVFEWKTIIITTSALASLGGILIFIFVPDGPYQKLATQFDVSKIYKVFKNPRFKSSAFGYFGHMWELYAFWTFVPLLLVTYSKLHDVTFNIPLLSFVIIGIGSLACVLGGTISELIGEKQTAVFSLFISCLCCLISPLIFMINSNIVFIAFLIIWGMAVISDSPLFSTLVAQNSDIESKGTALTIVNCIGFTITIISIQLLTYLVDFFNPQYIFVILAIGPIIGLFSLRKS